MGTMEVEVKVLDIDVKTIDKLILESGGNFVGEYEQKLYTYDLPTIFGRFTEILSQLNNPESSIKFDTALSRMKLLFAETDNLVTDNDLCKKVTGCLRLCEIFLLDDYLQVLNNSLFIDYMRNFQINPKKWIRLRESDGEVTLASKHILADSGSHYQSLRETEIVVPSFEEANDLLEQLGFAHKSYQEKRRRSYTLGACDLCIDFWPGIPPFMEVEAASTKIIEDTLKILGYSLQDTVSCTADEVYIRYGKSMFEKRALLFD